jgi:hypothetical protein
MKIFRIWAINPLSQLDFVNFGFFATFSTRMGLFAKFCLEAPLKCCLGHLSVDLYIPFIPV